MPRRKTTQKTSGVARKARPSEALFVPSASEEQTPPTLRTPVFTDHLEDVEETLLAIDEAALRAPRRTSLTSPRRDVG
jgi:hypothetical protein